MTPEERARELCDWLAPEFSRGQCESVEELRREDEVVAHTAAAIRAAGQPLAEALEAVMGNCLVCHEAYKCEDCDAARSALERWKGGKA